MDGRKIAYDPLLGHDVVIADDEPQDARERDELDDPMTNHPNRSKRNRPLIEKRREGDGKYGSRWRVLIAGQTSPFAIEKSIPPRYRCPQMWDVIEGDDPDCVLFDSSSLDGALGVIRVIAEAALAQHKD